MTPTQALEAQKSMSISIATPSEPSPAPSVEVRSDSLDELTVREVEVLRLVARGLTNEQVAEQLVISPRTVNSHLNSIYSKIGVESRTAATRYAVDHHMV